MYDQNLVRVSIPSLPEPGPEARMAETAGVETLLVAGDPGIVQLEYQLLNVGAQLGLCHGMFYMLLIPVGDVRIVRWVRWKVNIGKGL